MYNGDGFWMFPDPADPDYIYAEYQGGNVGRVNRYTHEARNIQPTPNYKEKLRWNWNTPIRSGRSRLHLRRISGRQRRPGESLHPRSAQHSADAELQGEAALELEHADQIGPIPITSTPNIRAATSAG